MDKNNFYIGSYAKWKRNKCEGIDLEKPCFVSKSGSKYYYTSEGVFRSSEHWGEVGSCVWIAKKNRHQVLFCKWEDFKEIKVCENEEDYLELSTNEKVRFLLFGRVIQRQYVEINYLFLEIRKGYGGYKESFLVPKMYKTNTYKDKYIQGCIFKAPFFYPNHFGNNYIEYFIK